ncbi:hypothetical protein AAMO2058_001169300 [Amorphochlora amoebiformis]
MVATNVDTSRYNLMRYKLEAPEGALGTPEHVSLCVLAKNKWTVISPQWRITPWCKLPCNRHKAKATWEGRYTSSFAQISRVLLSFPGRSRAGLTPRLDSIGNIFSGFIRCIVGRILLRRGKWK